MKQRVRPNLCPPSTPPKSCSCIYPRNKEPFFPVPTPAPEVITDCISGSIQQQSDGRPVQYWRWFDRDNLPAASVTVTSQCLSVIKVFVDTTGSGQSDLLLFTITEYGQSRSATLPRMASLEVVCSGGNELCAGRYGLTIHYNMK
ncbi:S-Ena type endospore appendage [Fictibacillus phosphorivorans]|uniref:S-Ena type endospore appendage n=1 Tax=Fictibacillus phosphorivorans TaxID=1221500 RepID=UPI00203D4C77|nr:S-Ena type endospore appendage [Fictibacillus phosphorivorans]MCM3717346.1 hypothetical protein [Fictibacillus phosphorivorans]MCM3775041.1 hypothetical protein [Fictibacillus phosphorivorans]